MRWLSYFSGNWGAFLDLYSLWGLNFGESYHELPLVVPNFEPLVCFVRCSSLDEVCHKVLPSDKIGASVEDRKDRLKNNYFD